MAVSTLSLPEALDSAHAAVLRSELLALRGHDVDVAAGNVQRPGTLCLQVLFSAVRTWAADGRAFRIVDASPALLAAASALTLPLPMEARA